ncbi:MAG: class I SAM-dependent methyltransferase [Halobacteriovoraceae bacterium]|nr:class I SAM-dependent methyltransferase [Halobacteriovoraceae bacterium]MCB9093680.1 class I SAM-dependent methyltransferase [Halobacteriovoraceae bacterium]
MSSAIFKLKSASEWEYYPLAELLKNTDLSKKFQEKYPKEADLLNSSIPAQLEKFNLLDSQFQLVGHLGRLGFLEIGEKEQRPAFIDIDEKLIYHERFYQRAAFSREPLYKALACSKYRCVWDASGGFLGDTLLLLAWGLSVKTFELNPLINVLIVNAVENSQRIAEFPFTHCPHMFQWSDLESASNELVVIYDPYYEETASKRKTHKNMQVLRKLKLESEFLSPPEFKANALLKRVVVKRALGAQELWPHTNLKFKGKSTRYDCYF